MVPGSGDLAQLFSQFASLTKRLRRRQAFNCVFYENIPGNCRPKFVEIFTRWALSWPRRSSAVRVATRPERLGAPRRLRAMPFQGTRHLHCERGETAARFGKGRAELFASDAFRLFNMESTSPAEAV